MRKKINSGKPIRYGAGSVALTAIASAAQAHEMFGNAAPFWSGVLHFLTTPLALANVIALAVALVDAVEITIVGAIGLAAVTTFIATTWSPTFFYGVAPQSIAAVCAILIGAVCAIGKKPSRIAAYVMAIGCGLGISDAVSADRQGWGTGLGASLTVLVFVSWTVVWLAQFQAMKKCAPIIIFGRRVTGATIVLFGAASLFQNFFGI